MKKRLIFIFLCSFLFAGCSKVENNTPSTNEIIWGDINFEVDEPELTPPPSIVERKDEINVSEYYKVLPINASKEVASSYLADIANNRCRIHRLKLNDVYFDINEIGNMNNYSYDVIDNIFNLNIETLEQEKIDIKVAQLYDGDTFMLNQEAADEYVSILEEYLSEYENNKTQSYLEYGGHYTYDKYVDFLENNNNLKHDISMYSKNQVLLLLQDIFKLEPSTVDTLIGSDSCNDIEYSRENAYELTHYYFGKTVDNKSIEIGVKRNTQGVFAFMVTYPKDIVLDNMGNVYFSPLMIINFAQNNYYQLAESYDDYIKYSN